MVIFNGILIYKKKYSNMNGEMAIPRQKLEK